ncbi:MAG: hypothetical protein ACNFW9_03805 [Candidatus Kerfeldbacteria bacterium]
MATKKRKKIALISVANKKGIITFARWLVKLGYMILASGGTAKKLKQAGIPVTDTSDFIGDAHAKMINRIATNKKHKIPPRVLKAIRKEIGGIILSHRVATLYPQIHGGILAQDTEQHLNDLAKICAQWIDIVCVDFYPLDGEIARPGSDRFSVIEKIDVGGPTMVNATAKSAEDGRTVICDQVDRIRVIKAIKKHGEVPLKLRRELAEKAFFKVAEYYLSASRYLSGGKYNGVLGRLRSLCKYGENAAQTPAGLYEVDDNDSLALHKFEMIEGCAPSFINFTDYNRGLQGITHAIAAFRKNKCKAKYFAFIYKHGNACGGAYGNNKAEVLRKAIAGNPRAAWGGIIIANFTIGAKEAEIIRTHKTKKVDRIIDGILAPSISIPAIERLKRAKGACRMLVNPALKSPSMDTGKIIHTLRGTFVLQPNYEYVFDFNHPKVKQFGKMTLRQKSDFLLAWAICATSSSNTITIVNNCMLIGNGTGQDDRVGAAQLATKKARTFKHMLNGSVCCSDSFFPYVDGVATLVRAGIIGILTVSGSRIKGAGDKAVKKFLIKKNVLLVWIPVAIGRIFYGHC